MNVVTLTPLWKVLMDSISRALDGTCYVGRGCAPTANGTGLRVDVAAGDTVEAGVPHLNYAGGFVTCTAASSAASFLYRRDIVYRSSAGTLTVTAGTPALLTATTPIPPVLPASATLIAVVFIAPGQTVLVASDVEDCRQVRSEGFQVFNVKTFGAAGDSSGAHSNGTDDTTAINNAVTAAGTAGGIVFFPPGIYRTTSMISIPRWVHLAGVGNKKPGGTYDGVSVIFGDHTGNAIVSYKGALGCRIDDLAIVSVSGTAPKTGLCLGRNSASSAGFHRFTNVTVDGYFTQAAVYSIASEENVWDSLNVYLRGGGAKYAFYTDQGDNLSVDTLTGSSNTDHEFRNIRIQNDANAGADAEACIYIEGGGSSGDFRFFGGYLVPSRGAYVVIRTGNSDGLGMPRGCAFYDVSGEAGTASTGPLYGFDLQSTGAVAIDGLIVDDSTMGVRAGGAFARHGANLTLRDGRITIPAPALPGVFAAARMSNFLVDQGHGTSPTFYSAVNTAKQIYGGSGVTAGAIQTNAGIFGGTGVPTDAVGNNGDFYLRADGGAGTCVYQRRGGVWVATGA